MGCLQRQRASYQGQQSWLANKADECLCLGLHLESFPSIESNFCKLVFILHCMYQRGNVTKGPPETHIFCVCDYSTFNRSKRNVATQWCLVGKLLE